MEESVNNSRVTLKEHLEKVFAMQDRGIDERFNANNMALSIQSREYERRLGELNNEAERILQVQTNSVSFVTNELAAIKEYIATQKGKASVTSVYLSYVASFIILLISIILHFV